MFILNSLAPFAPRLAGRGAFLLFGRTGKRAALRPDEEAVHAAAAMGTLTVNGKRVVTYRWGDGRRPVLLIHGWQSRASRWAHLIPPLQALGFTPVAFDAPGNGASGGWTTNALEYRAVILELHREYGPFEAVVAHSFGALCALLALRSGLEAPRLVAISGVTDFDYLVESFVRQAGLSARAARALRRRTEQEIEAVGLRWSLMSGPVEASMVVIHDAQDRMVDHTHAVRMAKAHPGRAQLVTTNGLGHHRILADPSVITRAVTFLSAPEEIMDAA
jgi:pimeloyl-ACP methyl ester carboxylesterase